MVRMTYGDQWQTIIWHEKPMTCWLRETDDQRPTVFCVITSQQMKPSLMLLNINLEADNATSQAKRILARILHKHCSASSSFLKNGVLSSVYNFFSLSREVPFSWVIRPPPSDRLTLGQHLWAKARPSLWAKFWWGREFILACIN